MALFKLCAMQTPKRDCASTFLFARPCVNGFIFHLILGYSLVGIQKKLEQVTLVA